MKIELGIGEISLKNRLFLIKELEYFSKEKRS